LRLARGLSLDDAAKQVGISPPYLSLIETEKRPLSPQLELKLLRLLWGKSR
jgi:transcriptional regulator with XRE-family HTH domain